jgi:single-stranded-DNA-specific exonuclease
MEKARTRWVLQTATKPRSVAETIELLLTNRGLDPGALVCRLDDLETHAHAIRNMGEAAELVARAIRAHQSIVLAGDYDCDGLTSLAQIALFLRAIGHDDFVAVTPASRADGYGMPIEAVRANPGAALFIALDCGTFDVEAVTLARAQGADVVVIDHHEIEGLAGLAPASVLVNPRHPECTAPFKEFATSGLVLLFLARLREALGLRPANGSESAAALQRPTNGKASTAAAPAQSMKLNGDYLALAAVGTIADMMPLRSANRTIVRHGLDALNRGAHPALQALRAVANLVGRPLNAGHIGFQIGPRLNAAARVADARIALDLLLTQDGREINRLANELDGLNRQRQQQVEEIMTRLADELAAMPERRTLVFADPDYPLGVNGILAQRAMREAHRPAIFLQTFPDAGVATGSARSIPGFNLYSALHECADLLERWGGHAMAAGLTLRLANLATFRDRLEAIGQRSAPEIFTPTERVDVEIDASLVTRELLDALRSLEPHGMGNPSPKFGLRDQRIVACRRFGSGAHRDHLELTLPAKLRAVYWGGAKSFSPTLGATVDLVCSLSWDDYRGATQLDVKDAGAGLLATADREQAGV